jgi:DNA polymerase-3 subunit alpha
MRVAQKFAGYSLAQADNLRKAMRQEDPRDDGQGARGFEEGVERTGYGAQRSAPSCSTSSRSSPTTPSTRATPIGYGLVTLPDRLPEGALPGRVPRLHCSPA